MAAPLEETPPAGVDPAAASPVGTGSADAEPRWLSPEERRTWMRLIGLTTLLPGELEAQLKRDAGLSLFEYHVLAMLSEAEERTRSMSDLAFWSTSSLSRLSHVVTRLEKQGWVRRVACPDDGRATNAVLTDAGVAHLEQHAPAHVAEVRRIIFDGLDEAEVRVMGEALGKILDRIDPAMLRQTET
ncbi:MarR family winged helix-turn-helix transcriptional regulator [Leucobacter soli]|uniref:HTH marR-type domain-containing protein n=1 Tax=Leucobacter soli TaxID=2812850 RepID=A0A916JRY4_9MICO|nr:MarR family transcriptional regulator [Leucobacter soli]CAG7597453.1 hypothetical protein LEUCIP111803_00140 [Leucobacter soli]